MFNLGLVRDVELRFTVPLAERAERVFSAGDSIDDLFRSEWHAGGNFFSRAHNQARSTEVFGGFPRLSGKYFVLLARQDSASSLLVFLNRTFMILPLSFKCGRL